jgi:hypothetical protein
MFCYLLLKKYDIMWKSNLIWNLRGVEKENFVRNLTLKELGLKIEFKSFVKMSSSKSN